MLDFKRVLGSAVAPERGETVELSTPWGEALDPEHVLGEHPRPTMVRSNFTMLNGSWEYAIVKMDEDAAACEPAAEDGEPAPASALYPDEAMGLISSATPPETFDGAILVPFSPEAPLSGVGRTVHPDELLWYRTRIDAPALAEHEHLILHFEAVDWMCAVYLDGALATTHTGGYLPFDVDITPHLGAAGASAELTLCVYDPSSAGTQLRGKQSLEPGGIWYTAQSGIWQSVWLEVVPEAHMTSVSLKGAADGTLQVDIGFAAPEDVARAELDLELLDADGDPVARATLPATGAGRVRGAIEVGSPHLWSPDDPYLYTARLALRAESADGSTPSPADELESYCAFRTVEVARDDAGTARFHLNGKPLFLKGVLDQGYWPDGLLTAPSDEALVFDIQTMKDAGFNMLRKHIKVESARWYYHCDRLGMLVWQDCVSGGGSYSAWTTSRIPTLFSASWDAYADNTPRHRSGLSADDTFYQREWMRACTGMVRLLDMHPSIVTWTLFNEGWGQFDSAAAAETVHKLDPTRPIDAASGWYDQHCGDYLSIHNYFRPLEAPKDKDELHGYAHERGCRAVMLSEFGGLAQPVEGHTFGKNAYGYGSFETMDEWRAAVRDELDQAEALEAQGLGGYVYTQITDVEDELNGLVTYDRRVNKLAEG